MTADNLPPLDPGAITGTSAGQMRAAPRNATYVIHNMRALGYFKALARAIGRDDLVFMSLGVIGVRELRRSKYIFDHYADSIVKNYQREIVAKAQA